MVALPESICCAVDRLLLGTLVKSVVVCVDGDARINTTHVADAISDSYGGRQILVAKARGQTVFYANGGDGVVAGTEVVVHQNERALTTNEFERARVVYHFAASGQGQAYAACARRNGKQLGSLIGLHRGLCGTEVGTRGGDVHIQRAGARGVGDVYFCAAGADIRIGELDDHGHYAGLRCPLE